MLCSEAIMVNTGADYARAVTIHCRAWSCEICQPRRQRELIELAKSGQPTSFITLTVNPRSGRSPDDRARMLSWAWRQVVKKAKKKYGYKDLQYLAVFEATKKGEPHLHIIARVKWIDQQWLSNQMARLIGAPIVDIRKICSIRQVASYVAKYIGKEPHRFKRCKRYWTTKSWRLVKSVAEPVDGFWSEHWYINKITLNQQQDFWEQMGWLTERRGGVLYGGKVLP